MGSASIGSLVKRDDPKTLAQLSPQEIEFLLILIKNSTFKGKQLEVVYTTVSKLQHQYISLQNP